MDFSRALQRRRHADESWASMKSFRPNDEEAPPTGKRRNGWEDF